MKNYKIETLIFLFNCLFIVNPIFSIDSLSVKQQKNFFGFQFSVGSSSFTNSKFEIPKFYTQNKDYRAGFAFDIVSKKYYGQRMGFQYINRELNQIFSSDNNTIKCKINMDLIHSYYYPIVLKSMHKYKIKPFIAAGLYATNLFNYNFKESINNIEYKANYALKKILGKNSIDFGYCISVGIYAFGNPIEILIENGITELLPNSKTKNITISVAIL